MKGCSLSLKQQIKSKQNIVSSIWKIKEGEGEGLEVREEVTERKRERECVLVVTLEKGEEAAEKQYRSQAIPEGVGGVAWVEGHLVH